MNSKEKTMTSKFTPNPKFDLVMERIVDVPREMVWKAWTTPELIKKWFTPHPWQTKDCRIDLRPGGEFYTVIASPEGEEFPGTGCFLEIIPNEKLTWTDALGIDFRPSSQPNHCTESFFTASIMLEAQKGGTKYTVYVRHGDEEGKKRHEERGFHEGWGKALEQMVEMIKGM